VAEPRAPRLRSLPGRGGAGRHSRARPASPRGLLGEGHVDAGDARRRLLVHRVARHPRAGRAAAADAVQHARSAARGGFFPASAELAVGRRAGARAARSEQPGQHAPGTAARRHGGHSAAPHRHGGDRCGDLRVRRGQSAATRQSGRRTVVRRSDRAPARTDCWCVGPRALSVRRFAARARSRLPRAQRPMGAHTRWW